jgi:hypothetical protein
MAEVKIPLYDFDPKTIITCTDGPDNRCIIIGKAVAILGVPITPRDGNDGDYVEQKWVLKPVQTTASVEKTTPSSSR